MSPAELRQRVAELYRKANDPAYAKAEAYKNSIGSLYRTIDAAFTPDAVHGLSGFGQASLLTVMRDLGTARSGMQNGADDRDRENLDELVSLFSQIDVSRDRPLPDAVRALDVLNVKLIGTPGKAGAASSSRNMIAVKTGDGETLKGFFTEDRKLFTNDPDGRLERMIRLRRDAAPGDPVFRDFCDRVLNCKWGTDGLLTSLNLSYITGPKYRFDPVNVCRVPMLRSLNILDNGQEKAVLKNANVSSLLEDVIKSVPGKELHGQSVSFVQYGFLPGVGIRGIRGSSVPGRNVAMSRVANLLGVPGLVARSVPITVNTDSGVKSGIFMEKAKGNVLPDIRQGMNPHRSPLADIDEDSFGGEALKQLADLQVLDYLCMNVDRHHGNMTYTVDPDTNRITGIMGIDNDLSFGTANMKNDKPMQNGSCLDDINVISEQTAQALSQLTPELLSTALEGTGLKKEEIDAACQRLQQLQDRLNAPLPQTRARSGRMAGTGVLHVIPDDGWDSLSLQKLSVFRTAQRRADQRTNLFGRAGQAIRLVQLGKQIADPNVKDVKGAGFGAAELTDELSDAARLDNRQKIGMLAKKFKGTKGLFHGATEHFTRLSDALDAFLAEPVKPAAEMREEDHYAYCAKLDALAEEAKKYAGYKSASDDTGRTGKNRLQYAQNIMNFANRIRESYLDAYHEKQERELSDAFLEAKEQESKLDRIVNTLTGEILKTESGKSREEICRIVKYGGVLENMLNENDDALDRYADMALFEPEELMKTYGSRLAERHPEPEVREEPQEAGIRQPDVSEPSANKQKERLP